MSMNEFVAVIESFNKQEQESRLRAETMIQNSSITKDSNGRYHAPHDDFLWIDDNVYSAGEYLPHDESHSQPNKKLVVKVALNSLQILKHSLPEASNGKTWEQNGVKVTKVYAEVPEKLHKQLQKLIPHSGKRMVTVEEAKNKGLNHGATWKFNLRGISNAFNKDVMSHSDLHVDLYCSNKGLVFGENIFFNDNHDGTFKNPKNKKATFYSPLSGKEVCYVQLVDYLI